MVAVAIVLGCSAVELIGISRFYMPLERQGPTTTPGYAEKVGSQVLSLHREDQRKGVSSVHFSD
jgi:hypothetical protein